MFKYIYIEKASDKDQVEINNFIKYCSDIDSYTYDIQYESEALSIPSIYFCYNNNNILGVLSVCEYSPESLCVYSLITPEYRTKHIFSTLLNMLYNSLKKENTTYKYLEFHLPSEETDYFNPAINLLNKYNFEFSHKEYLLGYDLSKNICSENNSKDASMKSSDIEVIFDDESQEFTLWLGEFYIGGCLIYLSDDSDKSYATIYDYEILQDYRGKGLGKIGIYLILKELQTMCYKNVLLHVTGLNKKAHNLYISCGFNIKSSLDIYIKEI